MKVFRVLKDKNYTVINNTILKDNCISYKAKGFFCMIMGLPDDWDFSINGIASISKEGKTAIYSCIDELEERGYVVKNQKRNEDGRIAGVEYIFLENPTNKDIHPHSGFPYVDNPDIENQPQLSTNINNYLSNKEKPPKYPSLDEFISYALDVDSGLSKKALEDTYNLWSCNNWVDGKGKKISNWKIKLKNKIIYLPKGLTKEEEGFLQSFNNNLKKANINFEYDDLKKQESKDFLKVVLSEYRDKMGGVLKLMINDKWHKENNYVYLTPDHYLKKQNFMKYLTKPSVYLPDDWKVRKLTNEQLQYVIDNIDPNYQDKYRRALIMGGIYKEPKIK